MNVGLCMGNRAFYQSVCTLLSLLAASLVLADDYEKLGAKDCRELAKQKQIMTMPQLFEVSKPLSSGEILDVVLLKGSRALVYEIELIDAEGVVRFLYLDARSGKLVTHFMQ